MSFQRKEQTVRYRTVKYQGFKWWHGALVVANIANMVANVASRDLSVWVHAVEKYIATHLESLVSNVQQ